MSVLSPQHGGLAAAAQAFLQRRVCHRLMRAAAVRSVRMVSEGEGGGLHIDFDCDAPAFAQTAPWLHAHAAALASAPTDDAASVVPPMTIAMLIVGSRGDVQPFIPLGQRLAERHRVRLATHAEFRPMVEQARLEFYPLAGDPHELMEYMVKTGGHVVPTRLDQLVEDVPRKRALMAAILESTWGACTRPDPDRTDAAPFRADAIIANPPSYGHIHCAEALHVPLHMVFTMPWTATSAFAHPLARVPQGEHHPVRNFLSYGVVDLLTWSGLADVVNAFRQRTLGLPPVALTDGAALLDDNEVPFTYLWPDRVVPKPPDWGPHIDLANFIFYDQGDRYRPPADLLAFLASGEPPAYVGFGSIVVDDPAAVSRTILAALQRAGVRGIVSQGWAHLGSDGVPSDVFLIGDAPHDWLFPRCRAVCHHGGAGTTAAGLRAGLPTVAVPFFGDQYFWGQVVVDAGAGPEPIPIARLDAANLAAAFTRCADEQVRGRAEGLGRTVCESDGAALAAASFHRHLPAAAMTCACNPDHLATVFCTACGVRLCDACATNHHPGHAVQPYRYVDWGARPSHGVARELLELVTDAAHALKAGLDELTPHAGPHRYGVVFGEVDAPCGDPTQPVQRHRRWLRER